MQKLLQIKLCGMKNIENEIALDFSNSTIEKGVKKINNVKGIFGYNGAGKSAIIASIDLYKKLICSPNYLMQNDSKNYLNKLINYVKKDFYVSMIFDFEEDVVIKHFIRLSFNEITSDYRISEENVSLSIGRTLNDKYKTLINKENNKISIDESLKDSSLNFLNQIDLDYSSFLQVVIKKLIDSRGTDLKISTLEKMVLYLYQCINSMEIYLLDSDKHFNYQISKDTLKKLFDYSMNFKSSISNESTLFDLDINDSIINKKDYKNFINENKKLEKFIQVFKPEIKEIKLISYEDKDILHIRKVFVYQNYNIELEFESSGIKQLVKLFSFLSKCANGHIVFIDEIDSNINAVYFEKLISFFKNYGQGQLIFTTHNIEAMKALKNQSRSIVVLGVDNKLDTWIGKGNKSPISDYITGSFPNSPMNVEDFDFINIFMGENNDWINFLSWNKSIK